MWLKTLRMLKDTLEQLEVADSVKLGGYAPSAIRPSTTGKGCVCLLREKEIEQNIDLIHSKEISIFLDGWVQNGSKDFEDGYEDLTALENRIESALAYFQEETDYIDDDNKVQFMGLEVREKIGDLDSVRPLIGVRYHIIVEVYKQEG